MHPQQMSSMALLAAVLLALLAATQAQDRYVKERVVVPINLGNGKTFELRLPRFLPVPADATNTFRRTYNDTCGLFDIFVAINVPAGLGPPPHLHYADDEWFIPVGKGSIRMYAAQKAKTSFSGQVPGYNAPAEKMGSTAISTNDVLYLPRGTVHYFATETNVTDFVQVHASGYSMPTVIGAVLSGKYNDPTELLHVTGLYGVPHDLSGRMVGMKPLGPNDTPAPGDYRSARGPVASYGQPQLKRLQKMFDDAEACYPGNKPKQANKKP